ncbi:MAG: hypothetical protein ACLP5H_34545 [Desulfomonilaceae bacterium]
MRNNRNVSISLALMAACVLLIGLWTLQATSSQANPVSAQHQVAADSARSDVEQEGPSGGSPGVNPGVGPITGPAKGEGAVKAPGAGEKIKNLGGIYCTRMCMSMPDLWDQSCSSVCTY